MSSTHFDHVGIAVTDTDAALKKYVDGLGGKILCYKKRNEDGSFFWTQIEYGGMKFEFLEPFGEGFLKNFLAKRGEGVHHITYYVDNIFETISTLERNGFRVVDKSLEGDFKTAFISPKDLHGVLIQVTQMDKEHEKLR